MTSSPVSLDQLIEHVRSQNPVGGALDHLSGAVAESTQLGEIADHLIGHFVDEARTSGASWTEIGEHLGVTKQAAQKRFVPRDGEDPDFPSGGRLSRFTVRARNVVKAAKQQAADLGATQVENPHLLLGLLSEPEGLAAKAMVALGVPLDEVRASALGLVKRGRKRAVSRMNFSREAKKTLELSLRSALRLQHNYIGTEHLLLGLLGNDGDPTATLLARLGVTRDAVEDQVLGAIADLKG